MQLGLFHFISPLHQTVNFSINNFVCYRDMSKNNPPMPLEVAIFKLHVNTPAFFTQHVQLNFPFEIDVKYIFKQIPNLTQLEFFLSSRVYFASMTSPFYLFLRTAP